MRIAMLTNNYRPFVGGVPVSVERQAKELIRLGHEVTVFAPMYGDTQQERDCVLEADRNAPEKVIRYRTRKKKMDNGMVYPAFFLPEITQIFEKETFDCIHVHHPVFVGPLALSLRKKYQIPVIYTYHTRYEEYLHYLPSLRMKENSLFLKKQAVRWIKKRVVPSYLSWFAGQCDLVLAPSAGMLQEIRKYKVTGPAAVFPTGLEEDFFQCDTEKACRIKDKYGQGKKYFLVTVSRLEKEKNYGFLLRGIAELKNIIGNNFHVLIIGEGSQKGELLTKSFLLGIRDMVTFAGEIPNKEIKNYLKAADLFLFASRSETQGIVLAEAFAAGTPVVAVHGVGSDDIVQDGINGYLTEENEKKWAQCAADALLGGSLEKMGQAALKRAENYRSASLAIYEEMLYNLCVSGKGDLVYEENEIVGKYTAASVQ